MGSSGISRRCPAVRTSLSLLVKKSGKPQVFGILDENHVRNVLKDGLHETLGLPRLPLDPLALGNVLPNRQQASYVVMANDDPIEAPQKRASVPTPVDDLAFICLGRLPFEDLLDLGGYRRTGFLWHEGDEVIFPYRFFFRPAIDSLSRTAPLKNPELRCQSDDGARTGFQQTPIALIAAMPRLIERLWVQLVGRRNARLRRSCISLSYVCPSPRPTLSRGE